MISYRSLLLSTIVLNDNGYMLRVVFYINVSIVQLGYEQNSFQRVPKLIQNLSNIMIKQVPMQQAILYYVYNSYL